MWFFGCENKSVTHIHLIHLFFILWYTTDNSMNKIISSWIPSFGQNTYFSQLWINWSRCASNYFVPWWTQIHLSKVVEERKKKSLVCIAAPSVMLKSPGSCSVTAKAAASFLYMQRFSVHQFNVTWRSADSTTATDPHLQPQQLPLSLFVVYTALYTEERPLHSKKTELKMFSATTPETGKQLCFCKHLNVEDKLFLIKMSLVDLLQLSPEMFVLVAPELTQKIKKKNSQTNANPKNSG